MCPECLHPYYSFTRNEVTLNLTSQDFSDEGMVVNIHLPRSQRNTLALCTLTIRQFTSVRRDILSIEIKLPIK